LLGNPTGKECARGGDIEAHSEPKGRAQRTDKSGGKRGDQNTNAVSQC